MIPRIPFLTAFAVVTLGMPALRAEQIYVTDGLSLTRFDTAAPRLTATVPITGLVQGAEKIVDIDLRPADNKIYALSNTSRMYTIDGSTGVATVIGSAGAFTLLGSYFGMDISPTADRIRVVSDAEQNLRLNPNTGVLSSTDTALAPDGNVVSIAYANNLNGVTTTRVYAIDSASGQLALIGGISGTPSANEGAVTAIGSLGLGTNLNPNIGFDVSGPSGVAYASITVGGESALYTINFVTGAATKIGRIGNGATPYCGLTAGPDLPLPSDQRPTVTISGTKDRTSKQPTIRIAGTASDDFAVAKVEYSTGGGVFLPAKGTTNWSATLRLTKRVTRVTVRAVDDAGAMSTIASVTIRMAR